MDDTNEFVEKLHNTQEKAKRNLRTQGKGSPQKKLSNKQHSTNK